MVSAFCALRNLGLCLGCEVYIFSIFSFIFLGLCFTWISDPFSVSFYVWHKMRIEVYIFQHDYPLFQPHLLGKLFFPLLNDISFF